jgi:hypothetical protein
MLKLFRNAIAAAGIGLSLLAAAAIAIIPATPAFSQANPLGNRTSSPRMFGTQQTHYLRFAINFNSCVPVSLTCTFKVGAVPYNAFMVRAYTQTYTTFSGGSVSAMTASFGTTSSAATNLMAAVAILTAGNAVAQTIAAGGLGTTVTGDNITPTGLDGGFDIYVTITASTGYPTAGASVGIIEYIAPNDGVCFNYPLGTAEPGC